MRRAIIDRFEGSLAICELDDKSFIDIRIDTLPKDVKEGDVIVIYEDHIEIDTEETKRRRTRINKLIKDMWE